MTILHRSPYLRSATAKSVGSDWRKVSGPICNGNPGGPDWIVRVVSTGRLYRVGDFSYQRMARFNAEPTPDGWLEIDETGEPVEYPEDDADCSRADKVYQFRKENSNG